MTMLRKSSCKLSGLEVAGFGAGTVFASADASIKNYTAIDEHEKREGTASAASRNQGAREAYACIY